MTLLTSVRERIYKAPIDAAADAGRRQCLLGHAGLSFPISVGRGTVVSGGLIFGWGSAPGKILDLGG